MAPLSQVISGILLLLLGVIFFLLTLLFLRVIPRNRVFRSAGQPVLPVRRDRRPSGAEKCESQEPVARQVDDRDKEAVMVIQSGGRVIYLNHAAREMFAYWEPEANLEALARRTRPADIFLGLCAEEGQARFNLGGLFVDGVSYHLPGNIAGDGSGRSAMLVSVHRPGFIVPEVSSNGDKATAHTIRQSNIAATTPFSFFTELTQTMASSLDLEVTLLTILENIERFFPCDLIAIGLWDEETQRLSPYRLVGMSGIDRRIEKVVSSANESAGYSQCLVAKRQPLLVSEPSTERLAQPAIDRRQFPYQSYVGLPLLIGGNLVGVLELASLAKNSFSQNDLEVMRLLAGQAAVAVNNALLYLQEQQRTVELGGLANLAQSVSSLRDSQDLFGRLLECIAPLLNVEVLGFLIYDENRSIIEAREPFIGLPPDVLEWCRTSLEPGSPAQALWEAAEPIVANDAPQDARIQALQLHHLALAAGIRHMVLMPLSSSGRTLGYLQAATKREGTPFDTNDLRLLAIIAGQAAPIIDNADLVQQSRRRAQRAESLRRIASLTSSSATVEEILKFSVIDLVRLLQADAAALFLLDESRGELRLHRRSSFGFRSAMAAKIGRLSTEDPQFPNIASGSRRAVSVADLALETDLPPFYRPWFEDLNIRSAISSPLVIGDRSIGELFLGSLRPGFFSISDAQTVATAAGQLASAIERAVLYSQTDESLRRRVDELVALTRVSRELNTTLKLDDLLRRVYDEVLLTTRADCGSVLLFDLEADPAFDSPSIEIQFGEPASSDLHPLAQLVLQHGEAMISDEDTPPVHAEIRSELVAPIAYQGSIAGLIHLHSKTAGHFGQAEKEIAEALAVQAAIALGNAQRYQEQLQRTAQLNRRVETLSTIYDVSQVLQTDQPLEASLEAIAYALQSTTPFEIVLISVYDAHSDCLQRTAAAGIPLAEMSILRANPAPWSSIRTLLEPQYRVGHSYIIPAERAANLDSEITTFALDRVYSAVEADIAWHADDMLVTPLTGVDGAPLGLISLDAPRNNCRPDRTTIETLEIFGSQAGLLIETEIRVDALRAQVEQLSDDLEGARHLAQQTQQHLPDLLTKDLEQTLAIRKLDTQARRIRAGLEITEIISRQRTAEEVLHALGDEILARMGFDAVLIVQASEGGPSLLHSLGSMPADANPKALLGQRNPLRHTLQTGELLISNSHESQDWHNTPLLRAFGTCNFLCIPIYGPLGQNGRRSDADTPTRLGEGKPSAALLAIGRTSDAAFDAEDRQVFDLLIRQAAIALQNLHLHENTTRRLGEVNMLLEFTRRLGSLDPTSILNSLAATAMRLVPAAQTAMVAIWDARHGVLIPQVALGYSGEADLKQISYRPDEGIPGLVFSSREPQNLEVVDFARHYNLARENLLLYRNATAGRLPVSCLAVPIATGSRLDAPGSMDDSRFQRARILPLGVLVLDNSQMTAAFTASDQAVITSLAQQTALALENARLYQSSRQRSTQLQALTAAAGAITASLQSEELINSLLDRLRAILAFDTGVLWLQRNSPTDHHEGEPAQQMVIRSASGFVDSDQRLGLTVDIRDSLLLSEMTQTGRPLWVADVRRDSRFQALTLTVDAGAVDPNLAYPYLSWLGIPLIASGRVIGVIALEKEEAEFYSSDEIQLATTFAGQAAVALENAELYEQSVQRALELDGRTRTLSILNRLSAELSGSLDAGRILVFAVEEFQQLMHCTSTSALLHQAGEVADEAASGAADEIANEPASGVFLLKAEYPASPTALPLGLELVSAPLLERLKQTLGIFHIEDVTADAELAPLANFLSAHDTRSLLLAPISTGSQGTSESSDRRLLGVLLAHDTHASHFDGEMVELARTFSNQVSIALQNARLLDETLSLTEDLELRVQQRTAELGRERQRAETLLRIITELSASLDLDQVLHRTLLVLSEYVDAAQITILIARPGERKLQRLASIGYTPEPPVDGEPTPFDWDEGLGGWIISNRQPVLVADVLADGRWVHVPYPAEELAATEKHRSGMGVPLMSGADALGCLLLFHPEVGFFSQDQLNLVQAAANQVSIAVNNAELYRLIRDQAEDLGNMLRSQQVETSRTKAILEAVADGVLVTDELRTITVFNESAEKILGLERMHVLGKSMEHFSGLFGRATQRWMETVETWTQNPAAFQPGETFAEQFTLEDGRVILVHLAPVGLRNDFLGTVSIFQDITHQVEVDRLKSEFVATVSHELRTPMTSIKGYVDILLMGAAGQLSEQQMHFLQVVKTNAERLSVLVNDLLDISQIEAGRMSMKLQPVSLEELIDAAIDDLKRRFQEDSRALAIKKEVLPGCPRALADPERIRRVLDNLLDNAFQYNLPNGRIDVRVTHADYELQIDISDTGVGIHPADQNQVFERFYRGDSSLTLGVAGTGLGLSIVQNLVAMHNGRIWLSSAGIPGEGSTFSFTLPVYSPPDA